MAHVTPLVKPVPASSRLKVEIVCHATWCAPVTAETNLTLPHRLSQNSTAQDGDTCVTFMLNNEDHTIGNALRYIIMKKYVVAQCG